MLERFRANRPQRFRVTMEVGPWPSDQVIAIPYPISHQQQTVTDLRWNSDGHANDHRGCLVISNGTHAVITAQLNVQPFHTNYPTADQAWQPIEVADRFYLEPDAFIHSADPEIKRLATILVPQPDQPALRTLEVLYNHTIERLTYGNPIAGLYTTLDALRLGCVDCGGFSTYLGALAQACGIPSRIVAGFWAGYAQNEMHAWVEALLPDGSWWPMDASVDWLHRQKRTSKHGGFGRLGSDRIVISVGTNHTVRYQQKDYQIGMLQLPMQLATDLTVTHLQSLTRIHTQRL